MAKHGVIYILNNKRNGDNVFNVGETFDLDKRIAELDSETSNVGNFEKVAIFSVSDTARAEKECHRELSRFRVHKGKEFFEGNQSEIVNIVLNVVLNYKPVDEFPDAHIPVGAAPLEPSATDPIAVEAQSYLAIQYETGDLGEKDIGKARHWHGRAKKKGSRTSKLRLIWLDRDIIKQTLNNNSSLPLNIEALKKQKEKWSRELEKESDGTVGQKINIYIRYIEKEIKKTNASMREEVSGLSTQRGSTSDVGKIYIANNTKRDGTRIFRIGFTKRRMEAVLDDLNGSKCKYGRYELVKKFHVINPRHVKEKIIYNTLRDYKIKGYPSDFKCDRLKIIKLVEESCRPFKVPSKSN